MMNRIFNLCIRLLRRKVKSEYYESGKSTNYEQKEIKYFEAENFENLLLPSANKTESLCTWEKAIGTLQSLVGSSDTPDETSAIEEALLLLMIKVPAKNLLRLVSESIQMRQTLEDNNLKDGEKNVKSQIRSFSVDCLGGDKVLSSCRALRERRHATASKAPPGFSAPEAYTLLRKVFPEEILPQLQWDIGSEISQMHPKVSVFFSDIVGFTSWASKQPCSTVIGSLSAYFQILDDLAERCGVYKVETIGDCWMAVCGAPRVVPENAKVMARFALEVLPTIKDLQEIFKQPSINIRIGIHCGSVVSGIVRADRPRWQLFGDTVNMASRMESTGVPGCIQISQAMFQELQSSADAFVCEPRGHVQVKGKGAQATYILRRPKSFDERPESNKDRLSVFNPPGVPIGTSIIQQVTKHPSRYSFSVVEKMQRVHESPSDLKEIIQEELVHVPRGFKLQRKRSLQLRRYSLGDKKRKSSTKIESNKSEVKIPAVEDLQEELPHSGVLVVDDMLSIRMQYRRVLRKTNLEVYSGNDGVEALSLLTQRKFVVTFLDLTMPNMSGSECVYEFRKWEKKNRKIKQFIVALSGKDDLTQAEKDDLLARGFDAIESKTNSRNVILQYVADQIALIASNVVSVESN